MGTFLFASLVHAPEEKRNKLQEVLEEWSDSSIISADIDALDYFGDWGYLPGLEGDDPIEITKNLSEELEEPSFLILICDSDYAYIELFDNDQHAKMTIGDPEMYEAPRENENLELFSKYLVDPYSIDDIKQIIEKDYTFADDGVYEYFEMCGIKLEI